MKVLDVAAGNGNFALAAARLGAEVTASDVTAHMVELGRARSRAEGLDIAWVEADAESLPFTADFDLVASVFGAMFAPRPELVAQEMFRAARPGGKVAMANYSSAGYLGRLSDLITTFSTGSPSALPSPFLWGDADEVRRRFAGRASALELERRTLTFRFDSLEAWREEFANVNPPLMALKQMLPPPAFEGLIAQAVALVDELNRAEEGAVILESSYLVVLARK
jgi:SAM-dependent methyltransferase